MSERVSVCVCVREREREREIVNFITLDTVYVYVDIVVYEER